MDGWNVKLQGWEKNYNKYDVTSKKLDVIIVLAGGLNHEGKVHEWVRRRLDRAIELHKIYAIPIICCGGGTYHKPPYVNKEGFVIHESTECVNYLIQNNINPNIIYREWSSYDTIANAFFSLTNHIWCRKWKHIGIITSDFHMPRTKEIFNWIYNLNNKEYSLTFYSVTDVDLDKKMIKTRKEREHKSLKNILKLREEITTIEQFHEWIYSKHNAYNNLLIKEEINEELKKTY